MHEYLNYPRLEYNKTDSFNFFNYKIILQDFTISYIFSLYVLSIMLIDELMNVGCFAEK